MPSQDHAPPRVSVIVPCRNEERYIAACLQGILASDHPPELMEVLVVDGRSDDRTREIVGAIAARDPRVRLLDNERRITPAALNVGIRDARHEVVVRMDAHATFPAGYIPALVTALQETGAAIVGGSIATMPAASTATARAIALAMQHPFGMGNSPFRVGVMTRKPVDHVPFFACRRSLFQEVGGFDEELVRNQDGEFSARVRRRGGRILLIPEARAGYYARDSIGQLGRMFFQYGYYKVLTARKVGRVMTVRQVVPPAFLLGLAALALLALVNPAFVVVLAAVWSVYVLAVAGAAVHATRGHPPACAAVLLVAFPLMHFAYGYGQLRRLAELALSRDGGARDATLVPLSR